jgi:hypothetical protein
MTSTLPRGTLGSVASLLAAGLYQGNPDRNQFIEYLIRSEEISVCYIYKELFGKQ